MCLNPFFFFFVLQKYNNYYISEHKNLLNLLREVGAVKRSFSQVKDLTSHDLQQLKRNLDNCSTKLQTGYRSALGDLDSLSSSEKVRELEEMKSSSLSWIIWVSE